MGLYERLLEEKRRLEEADTEEDKERSRQARRASHYIESQRKPIPEGGYVGSDEIREHEEKRAKELRRLEGFVASGPSSPYEGYAFAALRSKYRAQYLQLCRIHGVWARPTLASRYSGEPLGEDELRASPGEDQLALFEE